MKTNKVVVHALPFADCVLATALSPTELDHRGTVADPRLLDLPGDTESWLGLLSRAYALDGDEPHGLFGALHGLRCFGAQLHTTRGGMRLTPGEMTRDEYRVLRETYLVPHAGTLRPLLALTHLETPSSANDCHWEWL
jgi:hypothetical protein